jgi:hypothetical protein
VHAHRVAPELWVRGEAIVAVTKIRCRCGRVARWLDSIAVHALARHSCRRLCSRASRCRGSVLRDAPRVSSPVLTHIAMSRIRTSRRHRRAVALPVTHRSRARPRPRVVTPAENIGASALRGKDVMRHERGNACRACRRLGGIQHGPAGGEPRQCTAGSRAGAGPPLPQPASPGARATSEAPAGALPSAGGSGGAPPGALLRRRSSGDARRSVGWPRRARAGGGSRPPAGPARA